VEPLHIKYRPKELHEVIGQPQVKNIPDLLEQGMHSFLFFGNSGTGKTTLSRILGRMLSITDVMEIDAATYTGVDEMRELAENLRYKSLRGNGKKLLILDECHMLSKSSWNSLLKLLEEPPAHAYVALCTTEIGKVPSTIQTRCAKYKLNDLTNEELKLIIDSVSASEGILLADEIKNTIIEFSSGSARQVLVLLAQCRDVETVEDFIAIYKQSEGTLDAIDLCKALIKGKSIEVIASILRDLKGKNLYSVKMDISNYLTGCILRANDAREAIKFLALLECFDRPIEQNDFPALVLSVYEARLK